MRWAPLLLAALAFALAGCETTAEKSAKIERVAKVREAKEAKARAAAQRALTISRPSRKVHVGAVTLLHSSEGLAVVVALQSSAADALADVPVRVAVENAAGKTLYTNETPGQSSTLVSASLIAAHGHLQWIDDQIPLTPGAVKATAEVGEAPAAAGSPPQLQLTGTRLVQEASGAAAEGEVVNHSSVTQSQLVVYGVARRGSQVVAAGRAVLQQVPAGTSTRFQLFFVGEPKGAKLEVVAPASTL